MKNLTWRLTKLPTPDEVRELVKDKIISQEEAREILFNSESEEERDKKSLESEIKFLRDIIEKLAGRSTKLVEIIREVKVPYYQYSWVQPYIAWCGTGMSATGYSVTSGTANLNAQTLTASGTNNAMYLASAQPATPTQAFSAIKTF